MSARVALLTALALVAFAANSVWTRQALAPGDADPLAFALVRVAAGAAALWALVARRGGGGALAAEAPSRRALLGAAGLVAYLAFFSVAYLRLEAGPGALLLFGAVQITMFAAALLEGARFRAGVWLGLAVALAGLAALLAPGAAAPDPVGAALMAAAGAGWGVYSLIGRGSTDPLGDTARAFALALAPVALCAALFGALRLPAEAVALAVASGALASGVGYAVWYAVLPALGAGRAAAAQLAVPAIAALGGAALLSEPVTLRLAAASVVTLGGVWLALQAQRAQ